MTHPLTPREKVDVREIALSAMTEMRRSGESYEMCARWISERVNTAIASGSGDHAELARLAEAATEVVAARDALTAHSSTWKRLDKATVAYSNAINRLEPAVVLDLLAEIAALRGERDTWKQLAENGAAGAAQHIDRATEAERKLAEDADIFVELTLHHDLTPAMKDRLETLMQSRETTND